MQFVYLVCFWGSCGAMRVALSQLDSTPHAAVEVEALHFEVGRHPHNVSLAGDINMTKGKDSLAGREVADVSVQRSAAPHDRNISARQNPSARFDELVVERRAAHHMVEEPDQGLPIIGVALQRVSQLPGEQEDKEHGVDSAGHYSGSVLQEGSSNTSVQVLGRSSTMQGQLLWSIPSHSVTIPWHVAVLIFLLVGCVFSVCTAFVLRGGFNMSGKSIQKLGIPDEFGYESSSPVLLDEEDFDYSERPEPLFTDVTAHMSDGQTKNVSFSFRPDDVTDDQKAKDKKESLKKVGSV